MRIAQLVPNLDYGGVESYVVRLSRAMVELGHEVQVVTEGGAMEPLLAETGVALTKRSLAAENLPAVGRELRDGGVEILNAHNYKAARLGRRLAEQADLPWVMTVHGPRPYHQLALFRDWSPTVITISEGDKRNVTGWFGIAPERVRVSFLSIDPNRFHPREIPADVAAEYRRGEHPLIVHISRFSRSKGHVALRLVEAMPAILEAGPANLLLVGEGPLLPNIEALIARLGLGERVRILPPRLDVSVLFNAADLAIATATTAMEALACGTPLIAAGRTGHLGPIDEANFPTALDLLFADHDRCPERVTGERLARDVAAVLDDLDGWRLKAARLAEKMAAEFTPRQAAESVLGIYREVVA